MSKVCSWRRSGGCRYPAVAAALVLLLAACTPHQPYPLPERPQIPFGEGRLWQVDGAGAKPSYVFATLRAGDDRLERIPESVDSALQASDVAAFDVARDPLSQPFYSADRLKLPEGESLEDLIGARSFGILTWHMKQSELRPKDNIRPWAFWLYMGGSNWGFVDFDNLYHDHRRETFFNTWMVSEARRIPKKVVGLQSDTEAYNLYNKMPLELQAAILKVTLDHYSGKRRDVPKVQLYLKGDLATLDALWREYLSWLPPATAQILDAWLIVGPNKVLVERMVPLMRDGSAFVSVDVLHVPGEEGILRLLEQRGLTVTRLE